MCLHVNTSLKNMHEINMDSMPLQGEPPESWDADDDGCGINARGLMTASKEGEGGDDRAIAAASPTYSEQTMQSLLVRWQPAA
jgi:hypothetical protein